MNSKAFITIITPIKNRVSLFEETYKSVLSQSNSLWKWIIVDDGSDDKNKKYIDILCSQDNRISYISRDNKEQGASYCRNFGAERANSDYIVFLDADDILSTDFIKNRLEDIKTYKEFDFLAYRALVFHVNPYDTNILWNEFNDEDDLQRFLKVDTPWQTTGILWNYSFFKSIGGFNPMCKNWQDWEIHVRALAQNPTYYKIYREVDYFYRKSIFSEISTQNISQEFLIDRISTVKKIIEILKTNKKLSSKNCYYIAKLLFSIELTLRKVYSIKGVAIPVITQNRLLSNYEINLWEWYVHKGYDTNNSTIVKRALDKCIYLCRKDHFMETKTSFLNSVYKDEK